MFKKSKSPSTGKKYLIPKDLDDKNEINKFLNLNNNKQVIVVQGLGFVGSVMSIVCANSSKCDYAVIGVDLPDENNYWKIASINEGIFPVVSSDPKIEQFFKSAKKKKNFYATYDKYAYSKADFIIVDINLDVHKKSDLSGNLNSYDIDLSSFKKAIQSIGENCKNDVLVLIETTVPPGTCKKIIVPIIKNCFNKRNLPFTNFKLGHSYERVMPGPDYIDSVKNFYRVYSGIDKKSSDATKQFLKTVISTKQFPLTMLEGTNATEIAKVLENSYRAMNIAFITEWSRFAEESGVNLYEIIDAIRLRPTHSNMMYPGIGVGGYCLTKDPLLASWSREKHFNSIHRLDQSESGVKINDKMPLFAFDFMKRAFKLDDLSKMKIIFLGVSYRSNVGDTRYSPVQLLYNLCFQAGAEINLHDPYVSIWEELNLEVNQDLFSVLNSKIDILIITTSHDEYRNSETFVNKLLSKPKMKIFDTVGILNNKEIKKIAQKHQIKVLGRGDI